MAPTGGNMQTVYTYDVKCVLGIAYTFGWKAEKKSYGYDSKILQKQRKVGLAHFVLSLTQS